MYKGRITDCLVILAEFEAIKITVDFMTVSYVVQNCLQVNSRMRSKAMRPRWQVKQGCGETPTQSCSCSFDNCK